MLQCISKIKNFPLEMVICNINSSTNVKMTIKLPVCVRVCLFRSKVSLNPLPQKVHKYLFVSLWHFMCRFNSRCRLKDLEHSLHANLEGSVSDLIGGIFSTMRAGSVSLAKGFFMPNPPLISSTGASGGIPS